MAGCKESREVAKRPPIVPARMKIKFPREESLFEKGNEDKNSFVPVRK
jgi:hypothetical protein